MRLGNSHEEDRLGFEGGRFQVWVEAVVQDGLDGSCVLVCGSRTSESVGSILQSGSGGGGGGDGLGYEQVRYHTFDGYDVMVRGQSWIAGVRWLSWESDCYSSRMRCLPFPTRILRWSRPWWFWIPFQDYEGNRTARVSFETVMMVKENLACDDQADPRERCILRDNFVSAD